MSLKAIKEMVNSVASGDHPERVLADARQEIAALEKAAPDVVRLETGADVYDVRGRGHLLHVMRWTHPDAQAWSDAAVLLATIAKEAE